MPCPLGPTRFERLGYRLIAIPAIAILTLGASTFEAALLGFFEMLPFILFTLPAGVWVDRLRRRPILIAGDLGRALALSTIPVAYAAGVLTVWQLYAVAFAAGILTVFFDVADQSYLPSLVAPDQLVEGNAKLQTSTSAAQITGQGLGGAIIGLVTAPFAVVADALSFLVSAALIFAIRKPERPPELRRQPDTVARPGMRSEIAEGMRYVFGNRYLRSIAASTATSNLFGNLIYAVFFVYAYRVLELSPLVLGIILGVGNIGFLLGGALGTLIGLHEAIWVGAIGGLFAFLAPLLSPVWRLHEIPTGPEGPEGSGAAGVAGEVAANVAAGASLVAEIDAERDSER